MHDAPVVSIAKFSFCNVNKAGVRKLDLGECDAALQDRVAAALSDSNDKRIDHSENRCENHEIENLISQGPSVR